MASLLHDEWKIIQDGFDDADNRLFESLMSVGNGRFGLRGNHEETYSGSTLKGTYVAGVYYPDKTRVGWWKNGYPEYFAKVLNAVDFLKIRVFIDEIELDLARVPFRNYRRELDMRDGALTREFIAELPGGLEIAFEAERFVSYADPDIAMIRLGLTQVGGDRPVRIRIESMVDGDVHNEDANYGERFWEMVGVSAGPEAATVTMRTRKTGFTVACAAVTEVSDAETEWRSDDMAAGLVALTSLVPGGRADVVKTIAIISDRYEPTGSVSASAAAKAVDAAKRGWSAVRHRHDAKWAEIWANGDIAIEGDVAAQQGIRFNIFQLNCTFSGRDPRLNIGPKGFTGEKYGGSTYWDTEAYCLYFWLGTAPHEIAKSLLVYRRNQLGKAVENAAKLGCRGALFPMVTINGEECHNEWEITFEEIHRNAAIAHAVKLYSDYTGDESWRFGDGFDVLWLTARYWASRVTEQKEKGVFMLLGVTGPNEYENNVNNNWHTNRMAKWNLEYAAETLQQLHERNPHAWGGARSRLEIQDDEAARFRDIAKRMWLPEDPERGIFLQQDGFLDKQIAPVSSLPPEELPINRRWSWDRILRSCYIKQADVLQSMWFLNDCFSAEEKRRNFDFYEPITVHESSLSPCVHAILAAELGLKEKAHELYLRTSRLDLDNYNRDTEDGLHITSMAGTWMSVVYGFGGLRIVDGTPSIRAILPPGWRRYSFRLSFRDRVLRISVVRGGTSVRLESGEPIDVIVDGETISLTKD